MVAPTFVRHVAKGALNRVGWPTVRRQEHQLEPWLSSEPRDDRLRGVDAVVVTPDLDARDLSRRTPAVNEFQQVNKEPAVLALGGDTEHLAREVGERSGHIVFALCPRRHDFGWRAFLHPLLTALGAQVDVQLSGEKQGFGWQ